jgi:5-oxoprolinase (ATP-hydrolysing)
MLTYGCWFVSPSQTIAGGSGAGPTWHGTSGVHTHITNTRIGDVEILERRYPVMIHRFGLREGSGGKGKFNGGDGVVREIEFTEPLQVSILSEVMNFVLQSFITIAFLLTTSLHETYMQRRTRQPYGMEGGEPGALGRNTWVKQPREEDGDLQENNKRARQINIGGKATVFMGKGDKLLIETPGAGAWGEADFDKENNLDGDHSHIKAWAPRGSLAEREAAQAGF